MERRELEFLGSLAYFTEAKNVVEIGVQFGQAAIHLATSAQRNNGKYAGFDIWSQHGQAGQFKQMSSRVDVENHLKGIGIYNFELIQIDTINNKIQFEKELDRIFPDGIDLAFIDGDHSYLGIANDFSAVYPRLNSRGIIVFHDTAVIDGCREFVLDLRTKHYDGTYDIIDLPFGSGDRHCGLSILSKKSYPTESIAIDEICGSIHDAGNIESAENLHYVMNGADAAEKYKPITIDQIIMKLNKIGHYPGRKKYE
jgi:hypothetical protein